MGRQSVLCLNLEVSQIDEQVGVCISLAWSAQTKRCAYAWIPDRCLDNVVIMYIYINIYIKYK